MKLRCRIGALSVFIFVLVSASSVQALVDTSRIDQVREKGVLDSQDLTIIDEFLGDAVSDIVRTTDFTDVASTRATVLTRQSTPQASAQAQYAQQFSESARKYVSGGLTEARALPSLERRFIVTTNLLILIDGLKDPRLVDLALGSLQDGNKAVQYWAVRTVTNPTLLDKVKQNQATYSQLVQRITQQVSPLVAGAEPEVLRRVAEFAVKVDTVPSNALLLQIVDLRLKKYASWDVRYELLDGILLRLLCDKMITGGGDSQVDQRFALLYSSVLQRYIKGIRLDALPAANRSYLASVAVDVEDKCISRLLGVAGGSIRRVLEAGDLNILQREHDALLGSAAGAGALGTQRNFRYPGGAAGTGSDAPPALPDPPAPAGPSSSPTS